MADSKIFGVPLLLILLLLAFAAVVDVPMFLLHGATNAQFKNLSTQVSSCNTIMQTATPSATPVESVQPSESPTATPKATTVVKPTSLKTVAPTATPAGE